MQHGVLQHAAGQGHCGQSAVGAHAGHEPDERRGQPAVEPGRDRPRRGPGPDVGRRRPDQVRAVQDAGGDPGRVPAALGRVDPLLQLDRRLPLVVTMSRTPGRRRPRRTAARRWRSAVDAGTGRDHRVPAPPLRGSTASPRADAQVGRGHPPGLRGSRPRRRAAAPPPGARPAGSRAGRRSGPRRPRGAVRHRSRCRRGPRRSPARRGRCRPGRTRCGRGGAARRPARRRQVAGVVGGEVVRVQVVRDEDGLGVEQPPVVLDRVLEGLVRLLVLQVADVVGQQGPALPRQAERVLQLGPAAQHRPRRRQGSTSGSGA